MATNFAADVAPVIAPRIARRLIRALETRSFDSLRLELGAAEKLAGYDEERLELLGAIAKEIRTHLAGSTTAEVDLEDVLSPHLQLLRHLSHPELRVN